MDIKRPPGPPITKGGLALIRYFIKIQRDPAAFVTDRFERYGDLYYAPVGGSELYATRHPEHLQQALLKHSGRFKKMVGGRGTRALERLVGNGLVLSDGDHWRRQRRMINPAFRGKNLRGYSGAMVRRARRVAQAWTHGQRLDMSQAMIHLTLGIVGETLFDHDIHHESDRLAALLMSVRDILGVAGFLPEWFPLPSVQRSRRALVELDQLVYELIDRRLAALDAEEEERTDLLSALVTATDPEGGEARMTREQLRDELLTLFVAGHETTSHALTWTLYLLSQHPEVEARLLEEIDRVLEGRPVTVEDLDALPYSDQVIKESMRLFPPVPAIARVATEDTEIGGYTIPKGSELLMWLYVTHRDPRWFPNPERFDPERFTREAERALPSCAYLPFGAGQRACIGKRFALMEARLILVSLLQHHRFVLEPGFEPKKDFAVTLAPKTGMPMIAVAREQR